MVRLRKVRGPFPELGEVLAAFRARARRPDATRDVPLRDELSPAIAGAAGSWSRLSFTVHCSTNAVIHPEEGK